MATGTSAPISDNDGGGAMHVLKTANGLLRTLISGVADPDENEVVAVAGLLMVAAEHFLLLANNGIADPYSQIPHGTGVFKSLVTDLSKYISALLAAVVGELAMFPDPPTSPPSPGSFDQAASLQCPFCGQQAQSSIEVEVVNGGATISGNQAVTSPSIKIRVKFQDEQQQKWVNRCPKCKRQARTRLLIDTFGPLSNALVVRVGLARDNDWPSQVQGMMKDVTELLYFLLEMLPRGPISKLETFDIVNMAIQTAHMVLVSVDDGSFRRTLWNTYDFESSLILDVGDFVRKHIDLINPLLQMSAPQNPPGNQSQAGAGAVC